MKRDDSVVWKAPVALMAGVMLSLLPTAARAGLLTLQVGPADGDAGLTTSCLPGTHYVDLFLTETGPNENEGLFAYDLVFDIVGPEVTSGDVRLTGAERTPTDFVLGDDPTKSTVLIAQGPGLTNEHHMIINVVGDVQGGSLSDITSGKKAARIFYTVAPGTPTSQFRLVFDTDNTLFASGDPNRPEIEIPVTEVNSGPITVCPEPGGLVGLAGAAMLALWRRRPQRA